MVVGTVGIDLARIRCCGCGSACTMIKMTAWIAQSPTAVPIMIKNVDEGMIGSPLATCQPCPFQMRYGKGQV